MRLPSILLLALAAPCLSFAQESQPVMLANPDFEEGTPDDPAPGWTIERTGEVELTGEMPASGKQALILKNGYGVISQNFVNIPGLNRYKSFKVNVVARSPDAAKFGIRAGFFKINDDGKQVWLDLPLVWDRPLRPDNEQLTLTGTLPNNEEGGRFWIAFYRSKKEGTVILDSVKLEFMPRE